MRADFRPRDALTLFAAPYAVCPLGLGTQVAFGFADGVICVADTRMWRKPPPRVLDGGTAVATLRGHRGAVEALGYPAGYPDMLFSASCDGSLRVWDLRTATVAGSKDLGGPASGLAVVSEHRVLAAAARGVVTEFALGMGPGVEESLQGLQIARTSSSCRQSKGVQRKHEQARQRRRAATDSLSSTLRQSDRSNPFARAPRAPPKLGVSGTAHRQLLCGLR